GTTQPLGWIGRRPRCQDRADLGEPLLVDQLGPIGDPPDPDAVKGQLGRRRFGHGGKESGASRCEAVLSLISNAWLGSRWCINELKLACHLNNGQCAADFVAAVLADDSDQACDAYFDCQLRYNMEAWMVGRV